MGNFTFRSVDHIDVGGVVATGVNVDRITITNITKSGSTYTFNLRITNLSKKMKDWLNDNNKYCYLYLCVFTPRTAHKGHWSDGHRRNKTIHKFNPLFGTNWRIRCDNLTDIRLQIPVDESVFIDSASSSIPKLSKEFDPTDNWDYFRSRYIFKLANTDDGNNNIGVDGGYEPLDPPHWYSNPNTNEFLVYVNYDWR